MLFSAGIFINSGGNVKKLILIFFVIINTFIFSEEYISGKITAKLGSVKENNLVTDMELTEETEDIVVYEIKTGKLGTG